MNLALVVVDAHKLEYTRFINRVRHVKVRAETALSAAEVEGFRTQPTLYVADMPPEPITHHRA